MPEEGQKETRWIRKLVIVGEWGVGKTSLCRRYALRYYTEEYKPTIGFDILSRYIDLGNERMTLLIWDLGGQERFKKLYMNKIFTFLSGAHGALAVFDITNPTTLEKIPEWVELVRRHASSSDIPIVLVGNKIDLEDQRKVSREDAERVARELGLMKYMETSAKTGQNVDEAFETVVREIVARLRASR